MNCLIPEESWKFARFLVRDSFCELGQRSGDKREGLDESAIEVTEAEEG